MLANIEACVRAGKAMVVGTTGWYGEMERVRQLVEQAGTGFVFGANFSYGVNLFFQIVEAAAPALTHGYQAHITERHHINKKDAPSGTAVAMQRSSNRRPVCAQISRRSAKAMSPARTRWN